MHDNSASRFSASFRNLSSGPVFCWGGSPDPTTAARGRRTHVHLTFTMSSLFWVSAANRNATQKLNARTESRNSDFARCPERTSSCWFCSPRLHTEPRLLRGLTADPKTDPKQAPEKGLFFEAGKCEAQQLSITLCGLVLRPLIRHHFR
jgi:hypothetical protein